jgi:hypothetical protein
MLGNWSPSQVVERHKALDRFIHCDPALRDIHRFYQLLDGKSTALFSHVSIMIAACTFMSGSPTNGQPAEKIFFLLSTLAYLFIAIFLLKILDFSMYNLEVPLPEPSKIFDRELEKDIYGPENDLVFENTRAYFASLAWARGRAHRRALLFTLTLTIVVIFLFVFDVGQQMRNYKYRDLSEWIKSNVSSIR